MPDRKRWAGQSDWDANNIKTVSCRMRADLADAFRKYAEERETTVNALLSGYVKRCLKEADMIPEE